MLKRMLFSESSFQESKMEIIPISETTPESFEIMLEYLYTEHTTGLEKDDVVVDVLQLSDYYLPGQSRLLSMCELYISKLVERCTANDIVNQEEIDLVGLLNLTSRLKAEQLKQFLLHFFCVNFFAVKQRSDFSEIEPSLRQHIEKNQWPPVSYFDSVKKYEKDLAKWKTRNKKAATGGVGGGFFAKLFKNGAEVEV
jgi:hypothetical protein